MNFSPRMWYRSSLILSSLHEVTDGKEEKLQFDQKLFDYGKAVSERWVYLWKK